MGLREEDLQTSRREVWKKMNSDKVREEYILSFEDFKTLYPNEEYRDYLQYMETKVYKDLMSDMVALWPQCSSATREPRLLRQ